MDKNAKSKTRKPRDSFVVKITMSLEQHRWLKDQAGRGNVAEFVRSKVFGDEYRRNTTPAARYSWELAVAVNWVGNNLQRLTEKTDVLAKVLAEKQGRNTEIIAFGHVVKLLQTCTDALIKICKSLSRKEG